MPPGAEAQLTNGRSVQVIDISQGGVLLFSARSASVGARGKLSLRIGDGTLVVDVEIRRVSELANRPGFRIGAMFTDLAPEHSAAIARFTGQSAS